jgi:hypothetical protein
MAVGAAALIAFETALILVLGPNSNAVRGYLLGLLHMGIVAAFVHLANSAFVAHDREAILHVRGAWGEENTRNELKRAKRKRMIWGWVDSLTFVTGDIDHLVVTRSCGLVAIDSKWRTDTAVPDRATMAQAAQKARRRAEAVTDTVLKRRLGSRRASPDEFRVTPLLVLWGPAQHSVPDEAMIDGVAVVGGRRLLEWLRRLDGAVVDKHVAVDLLHRLEEFRARAWDQGSKPRDRA